MKRILLLWAAWAALGSAAMTDAEFENQLAVRRGRTVRLREQAESLRGKEPDFADWVARQAPIYAGFERALRYDQRLEPGRRDSLFADWDYLLTRMEEQCAYFAGQRDPASTGTVDVRAFGARGDGVHDDGPAIRAAIAAAAAGERRRVFLPAGRYLAGDAGEGGEMIAFSLKGIRDLTIEGEPGTVISTINPRAIAFMIDGCDNVRLKDFHVTAEEPAFTTGRIVGRSNPDVLEIEIDPGMPDPLLPYFRESNSGGLCRFASGTVRADGRTPTAHSVASHAYAPEVTHLEGRRYRFKVREVQDVEAVYANGMKVIYYARDFGQHKISNRNSDHTRITGISIDSSSGMAFINYSGEAVFLTDCSVGAAEGVFASTGADGIYFINAMLGSYIARNRIADIGDDFVNVHTVVRPAYRQEGNVLYFPPWLAREWIDGMTRLGYVPAASGKQYVAEEVWVREVSVEPQPAGSWAPELVRVVCDRALPPVVTLEAVHRGKAREADMFMFPEVQNHGTVIDGNRFGHGISRILPGGRNWAFSNNTVDDNLGWVVLALFEQTIGHMDEAFYPRNITVTGNRITSLHKTVFRFQGGYDPAEMRRNMAHFFIEDNDIEVAPYGDGVLPVIAAAGVDHLEITGNRIRGARPADGPWLEAGDCRGVVEKDNAVDNLGAAVFR